MPKEFLSFQSWSLSVRRQKTALIHRDEASSLAERDYDYTELINALSDLLQDFPFLDLGFDEGMILSLEKSLGRGSSFIIRTVRLRGGKSDRPQLVYKRTRIGDDWKRRIVSLVREARILSHPILKSHPNIIGLKGIAWEQDDASGTALPVLVLEYTQLGDLSFFLQKTSVNMQTRTSFCLDVAKGLHALHTLGIAHGDVKCENVLVFEDASYSSGYIAKLTDFGFAEVCSGNGMKRLSRGTFPWNAPEWMDLIDEKNILLTDVYSLGLLMWRCMLNGQNPFENEPFASFPVSDRTQETEDRKQNDQLLEDALSSVSKLEGVGSNMKESFRYSLRVNPEQRDLKHIISLLQANSYDVSILPADLTQAVSNAFQDCRRYLISSFDQDRSLFSKLCLGEAHTSSTELRQKVDDISSNILACLDGAQLERVLDNLKARFAVESSSSIYQEKSLPWKLPLKPQVRICFDSFEHVPPMTKESIFTGLVDTSKNASTEQRRSDALIHLCMCYTMGFGTSSNPDLALQSLVESAKLGNIAAQALVKRMHNAFAADTGHLPITKWLIAGAETGSVIAIEDLRNQDLSLHNAALRKLNKRFCGLGVQIFDDEILDAVANEKLDSFIDLKSDGIWLLNSRGDNIVHCVASCGSTHCLRSLIRRFPEAIDSSNQIGETPLLFACRAGNYENTMFLLEQKARTAPGTPTGETPMHWLTSFEEEQVRSVAMALVENGGYYMVWSIAEANTSCFAHYYNGLGEGTPLHRAMERRNSSAVTVLLELESSYTLQRGRPFGPWRCSPLMLACAMHDTERLRLLLESNRASECIQWRPTDTAALQHSDLLSWLLDENSLQDFLEDSFSHSALYFALHPFDLHHRICLHGANYRQRMTETIDLLLEKGALIDSVSEDKQTGFFAAAQSGDVKIVEKVVSVEGLHNLNTPCLSVEHSPLQQMMYDGHKETFLQLLDLGVDVKGVSKDGNTMLQTCALSLLTDNTFAMELIKRGAPVACQGTGTTALCTAVLNRRYELAKLLLEAGADVNEVNLCPEPLTTLGAVLTLGQYSLHSPLKFLLSLPQRYGEVGFAVNDGASALHFAAFATIQHDSNNVELIFSALLGKFGAAHHLEWKDTGGYNALDYAIFWSNLEAVRSILRAGAKVNYVQKSPSEVVIPFDQPLDLARKSWLMNFIRTQTTLDGGDMEEHEGEMLEEDEFYNNMVTLVKSMDAVTESGPWKQADPQNNIAALAEIADILRNHGAKLYEELIVEYKEAGLVVEEGEESGRVITLDEV